MGLSITTVKRRIRAGTLRAESVRRPQGTVWLVYLSPEVASDQETPVSGQSAATVAATTAATTPAADAMVSLIQATIGTILGPLVAELGASRQTVERQADALRQLEREYGRQAAKLERAASAIVGLGNELEQPRRARRHVWWIVAAIAAATAIIAGAVLQPVVAR